jgi:hypothetical protein
MSETEQRLPWQLARLADCMDPSKRDSAGAEFLFIVEDAARERWWVMTDDERVADDIADTWSEVADSCVPIYTHNMWQTFADLGAWQEDPTDLGADADDMTKCAMVCLYMIAERLCHALAEEWAEENEEVSA